MPWMSVKQSKYIPYFPVRQVQIQVESINWIIYCVCKFNFFLLHQLNPSYILVELKESLLINYIRNILYALQSGNKL